MCPNVTLIQCYNVADHSLTIATAILNNTAMSTRQFSIENIESLPIKASDIQYLSTVSLSTIYNIESFTQYGGFLI